MKLLVAGSSGYLGQALRTRAQNAGHSVTRLVRRESAGPDEVQWDPAAGELNPAVLAGYDAVINFCGASLTGKRWTGKYKQQLWQSRIGPAQLLADAAARAGTPTLVSASAVGIYGDRGSEILTEHSDPGTGFLAELCQAWEAAATPKPGNETTLILLRTGLVTGPGGGLFDVLSKVYGIGLGGRLGTGEQFMPWISLHDYTAALLFLLDKNVSGPVNLVGPAPVSNTEFNRVVAAGLHRPAPWKVPGPALRLLLGGFADEGLLVSQRAIPEQLRESGFTFTHTTLAAAVGAARAAA